MRMFTVLIMTFALNGCGSKSGDDDSGGGDKVVTPKSDTNGVVVATIDPNATNAQTIKSSDSSSIKGSSVTFPPGSLAIATDITLEAGLPVANAAAASELGLNGATLREASPTVVVESSVNGEAAAPFTLAIALSSPATLIGENDNLIVIYKVEKADGTFALGVIPTGSLTIDGASVTLSTKSFGAYQAAYSSVAIAEAKEVATATSVTSVADLTPYLGTWVPNCFNGTGTSQTSDEVWLYIDADGIKEEVKAYENSDCSGDPSRMETAYMAYSIGEDSAYVSGAKDAEITLLGGSLVAYTDAAAAKFNQMNYCGFSDWEKDAVKDISDQVCDDEVRASVGLVYYTVVKIDGDKLYLGEGDDKEYDMTTPAKRSRILDDEYRTKQ